MKNQIIIFYISCVLFCYGGVFTAYAGEDLVSSGTTQEHSQLTIVQAENAALKAIAVAAPSPIEADLAKSEQLDSTSQEILSETFQVKETQPILPNYGDMLVIGLGGEPTNLLPFMTSDSVSREVASNFYVGLLQFDKDLNVVPYAAKSFEVVNAGRKIRFVLRDDILWSDGTPLTVEDVRFTYEIMIDPETPTAYAGDYLAVESFQVIGKDTIEVTYKEPFPRALSSWMAAIMPKHALEKNMGQELRNSPLLRKPISSGPYLLDEWKSGSYLRVRANPDYFEGEPYISSLLYRFIPDATTLFLELKAGNIDLLGGLSGQQYVYQTNTPEFKENFHIYSWLSSSYVFLGFNLKSPMFSDVHVRQALAYAVNKQDIVKGAIFDQGQTTIGPFSPNSWAYNTAIKDYEYNPVKALEMLGELGWHKNTKGILEKDGRIFSFTLLVNQGNESRIKTAVLLQHQLKNIGVDVQIRIVEWAAFIKDFVTTGFFDAIILAWTLPAEPDAYDVWHSSRIGGGLNFTSYANDEADTLLVTGRTTFDIEKRKKVYDRFQEILHEEQPYIFLYVPYAFSAVHKRVKGIAPAPAGIGYNRTKWWIPQTEQRYKVQN